MGLVVDINLLIVKDLHTIRGQTLCGARSGFGWRHMKICEVEQNETGYPSKL